MFIVADDPNHRTPMPRTDVEIASIGTHIRTIGMPSWGVFLGGPPHNRWGAARLVCYSVAKTGERAGPAGGPRGAS
jgi:hypothetical protein